MSEELVGTVTHYFARPQVGIVKLSAAIKLGDTLHVRGHTADFQQEVASLEIEHAMLRQRRPEPRWGSKCRSEYEKAIRSAG